MKDNNYYVYRLMFNDQTIYIGSTEKLGNRIKTHSTSGVKFDKVTYTTLSNKEEMLNTEYSLIHKYNPIYNKRTDEARVVDMDIDMFKWETNLSKSKRIVVYHGEESIHDYDQLPESILIPLNILNGGVLEIIPEVSFSISDRIVYAFLRGCYIEKGEFVMLQEFIAESLNLSQRTVNRAINILVSVGLVTIEKGFRSSIRYKNVK